MKKRLLALLLVVLMTLTAALAGCGGPSEDTTTPANEGTNEGTNDSANQENADSGENDVEPENQGTAGEPTTIELWTFQELHLKFYEQMKELWNEENPDRPIELETLALADADMHNNLQVSLQSGTGAPDIVDIEVNKFPNFIKGEPQLLPLNDIVEPELNNIVQARVNLYSKDGNYYGICFHVGAEVMYYNKEILDEAGVDPNTIELWDDYAEAAKVVLEKTGKPMGTIEITDSWTFWPLMSQQGSDFFDAEGNVILDNEININIMRFLKQMLDEGTLILAPGGKHHAEEYYGFMNQGGAASVWMPMWYMGRFTDYMPDLSGKMIIRPMPRWDEGGYRSATMGGTGTAVTVQCENPDLAKEFLSHCKLSREGNIQIWKILGFDPIRIDVWDDPAMKEPNKYTDYFGPDIFDTLIEVKDEFNDINLNELNPVMESLNESEGWTRIFVNGEDPEVVLKDIADQVRAQQ